MIPTERPHLEVAALTHPGERRKHNEDRYSVSSYRTEADGQPVLLAIVADGIGGHQAGEVASEITVERIRERLAASDGEQPLDVLRGAAMEASKAVFEASQETPERTGMGSTVAIAWILGDRLYTASAGDSRLYLLRGRRLRQISQDHTWVQEALDRGIISPAQAEDHPNLHVLRRYVGGPKDLEPDLRLWLSEREGDEAARNNQGLRLEAGDRILLCSDGLTDLVDDKELEAALRSQSPRQAVQTFIDQARARGGHDNITAVVISLPAEARSAGRARGCARWLIALLALLIGAAVISALAASWWYGWWPWTLLDGRGQPTATQPAPASPDPTGELPPETSLPAATATFAPDIAPTLAPPPGPTSTPIPLPTVPTDDT